MAATRARRVVPPAMTKSVSAASRQAVAQAGIPK